MRWMGKWCFEDEVAAILHLADGVEAAEVHGRPLAPGELRPQDERPVVEPLADDGAEVKRSATACSARRAAA